MAALPWAWIPITLGAALAQTLRNAAQRHLTGDLGALGATLVRFFYGLPFAALGPGGARYQPGLSRLDSGGLAEPDRGDRAAIALHARAQLRARGGLCQDRGHP